MTTVHKLTPALATHRGMRRRQNEDAVGHYYPPDAHVLRTYGALFVVADGVGGLERGADASQMAVDLLTNMYYQQPADLTAEERIARAIHDVNQAIYTQLNREGATTLVAAVVLGDKLITASVGDSLVFRVRDDAIAKMSDDDVVGGYTDESGALTQAVGYRDHVEVETVSGTLQTDDRILLCSDGVTRYLNDDQLIRFSKLRDPRDGVRRMINQSNNSGGADNISAALIHVGDATDAETAIDHLESRVVPVSIDSEPMMTPAVNTKPTTQIPQGRAESVPDTNAGTIPRASSPSRPTDTQPKPDSSGGNTLALAGFGVLLIGAAIVAVALLVSNSGDNPTPTQPAPAAATTTVAPASQPTTAPVEPTATVLDTTIDEGDTLRLSESVLTRVRVNDEVASFATSPDTVYAVRTIVDDADSGLRWYELYDEANDRTGWLSEETMPAYTIVSSGS